MPRLKKSFYFGTAQVMARNIPHSMRLHEATYYFMNIFITLAMGKTTRLEKK